jgi:hypothetical protein
MASKYSYLFDQSKSVNLQDLAAASTEEATEEMKVLISAWDKHLKSGEKTTLGEAKFFGKKFAEALQIGTSKNGFPQVQIGEGPTHLGLNTISGINALRSIASGKYEQLEWHFHKSWFDPRRDAEGVISVFVDGEWKFFDWRNGAICESRRMDKFEYQNRVRKHEEIDKLIQSLKFGSSYTLVFNRDQELALFQQRIKESLEKTCAVVWEEIAQEYAEAASKSGMLYGNNTVNNAIKPSTDRLVVDGINLAEVKTPVNVTYRVPSSTRPVVILFDPTSEGSAQLLNNLLYAPPAVQLLKIEPLDA